MKSEHNDRWLAIIETDMPFATKQVAVELVKWADKGTGQVNLGIELFLVICGCENEQAAKRHLTRMRQAGLIHYSSCATGDLNIFITFLNWHGEGEEPEGKGRTHSESENNRIFQEGGKNTINPQEPPASFLEDDANTPSPNHGASHQADPSNSAQFCCTQPNQLEPEMYYSNCSHQMELQSQLAVLQKQVSQLQETIDLLCQRLGGEDKAEVQIEVEGRADVGALGKEEGTSAPNRARRRARVGAERRGYRRVSSQQTEQETEVSLFVNNNTLPEELINKLTNPVPESAPNPAREEPCPQITQITQIQDSEKTVEPPTYFQSAKESVDPSSSSISLEERDCSFRLLTDPEIGVGEWKAKEIAQRHQFDYVRRQTFAWLAEMEIGKVRGVGALVNRMNRHFGAGKVSTEQQRSALYQRHRTGFEVEAEAQAQEEFAARKAARSQAQAQSQPKPQSIDPALWPQVLAKLKTTFPSTTYDHFLEPTQLLGMQDNIYRIGLPNAFLRDGTDRYKGTIRRTLAEVVGDEGVRIRLEILGITKPTVPQPTP